MEIEIQNAAQTFGDKDNFLDFSELKVKKINKTTRGMFGKIIQHVTLDNSYTVSVNALAKQGGEYRPLPYKVEKGACDFCKEDEFLYPELVATSDIPDPLPCPILAVKLQKIQILTLVQILDFVSENNQRQRLQSVVEKFADVNYEVW